MLLQKNPPPSKKKSSRDFSLQKQEKKGEGEGSVEAVAGGAGCSNELGVKLQLAHTHWDTAAPLQKNLLSTTVSSRRQTQNLFIYSLLRRLLFTADILTLRSSNSRGVTNAINRGSITSARCKPACTSQTGP